LEDRVKVRLTGAAILVVLVVVLVPEVFRGERPGATSAGSPATDGTPLRSYTIDLDAPDPQLPAVVVTEPMAPSPGAPASPASSTPVAVALAAQVPADVTAATAVRAGWVVQLGTFTRRENAERMASEAARKGLRLAVAGPDDRGLYRVRSTSIFPDRQSAAALQERLKELGYPGMVNTSQ
jgi:cell division septation protein DedD